MTSPLSEEFEKAIESLQKSSANLWALIESMHEETDDGSTTEDSDS
jgi:hypothetical protein